MFAFAIGSRVRVVRDYQLSSLAFLLSLHPHIEHWRGLFPGDNRVGVDKAAACAYFMRACVDAGVYQPESMGDTK